MPPYSLALAHVNDFVTKEELVAASGGLLLMHGAGAAVGPVIAGFAMSAGPLGLSYTHVALHILIVVWGNGTVSCARRLRPAYAGGNSWSSRPSRLEPSLPSPI